MDTTLPTIDEILDALECNGWNQGNTDYMPIGIDKTMNKTEAKAQIQRLLAQERLNGGIDTLLSINQRIAAGEEVSLSYILAELESQVKGSKENTK